MFTFILQNRGHVIQLVCCAMLKWLQFALNGLPETVWTSDGTCLLLCDVMIQPQLFYLLYHTADRER